MKKSIGILLGLLIVGVPLFSQKKNSEQLMMIKPKGKIVCYASNENHLVYMPPPTRVDKAGARVQTADIRVDFIDFPADARSSFLRAVDIWATLIQSPVRINIRAAWVSQDPNTLGSASWGNAFANFDGAPKLNVFYPVALAEKLAGRKLNADPNPATGDDYDIYAFFNSNQSRWNFTDTPTPNTYNFTTVVLHEIGHGLGFFDSYDLDEGSGSFGVQSTPTPIIFDVGVENSAGTRLLNQANNSIQLANTLTNNNISYNPARSLVGTVSERPKLFAPATWSGGSSIAHLDQTTYSGTVNRLMRPQLDLAQVVLDPGPLVLNMFADMGWVAPVITHTPLKDTETTSTDFTISVTAAADGTSGYTINAQLKLRYQINGGTEVELTQTPTSGSQYTFVIPKPIQIATPTTYNYYLVSTDNYNGQNRTFAKPGQIITPGQPDQQNSFQFTVGPDIKLPEIKHTPVDFILISATSIALKATITDNIGVQSATVSYKINLGSLQNLNMIQDNDTLSLYKATIPASGLADGNTVSYRIIATDNSSNQNQGFAPSATTFYEVAVVGSPPAQNSYTNNFNSPSTDFFGNGYSIITPTEGGFNDGAIHSLHPYAEAGTGNIKYIYQLRFPIKVKSGGATIKFDEIVLVEPGEPNSVFGQDAFYDYVVTEGSKDGGITWIPFADGYDSRDFAPWLAKYKSSIVSDISKGIGDPTLFRNRTINMLDKFRAGDEVSIRFLLFSDPGAAGWGWAIDNLKIQIDDAPPAILHNHVDYVLGTANALSISANVTDVTGVDKVFLDYSVNNGSVTSVQILLSATANTYTYLLDLTSLNISGVTKLNYRIRATDALSNSGTLPTSGFFDVTRFTIGTPQNSYISDFNTANSDFVGNFFLVATPAGFSNGAIHSAHPYVNGFGLPNATSNFTFTLSKPITISANNPFMSYDEIGIVEPINDLLFVDGSKDNGATWQPFIVGYSATAQSQWLTAYDTKANGTPSLFKTRLVNLTQNGSFKSGDQVLIRFRLNVNQTVNAWGWAIDNLSIQGPITGIEPVEKESLNIYPNPSKGATVTVELVTEESSSVHFQILNSQGQLIQASEAFPVAKKVQQEFSVSEWANGLYLIKAEVNGNIITKKFIKAQ